MQLNPIITAPTAQTQKPISLVTPAVQAMVAPAVATQLQSAPLTRTQTTTAATAAGRSDRSNASRSGSDTGRSVDTAAGALDARATGPIAGRRRGSSLDVSV